MSNDYRGQIIDAAKRRGRRDALAGLTTIAAERAFAAAAGHLTYSDQLGLQAVLSLVGRGSEGDRVTTDNDGSPSESAG